MKTPMTTSPAKIDRLDLEYQRQMARALIAQAGRAVTRLAQESNVVFIGRTEDQPPEKK